MMIITPSRTVITRSYRGRWIHSSLRYFTSSSGNNDTTAATTTATATATTKKLKSSADSSTKSGTLTSTSTSTSTNSEALPSSSSSSSSSFSFLDAFTKEASRAPIDFDVRNRWKVLVPAATVNLSIGSVYVYSMWTYGLTTASGVVSASPFDWDHSQVLPVLSAAAVTLGVTTSTLGEWVERSGPRKAGAVGSIFWSAALVSTAAGVQFHSLPLVYLGYGLFGGIGWGLMYLSPVTTCMKFFPDKRGLATGISLSAFGAGAAVAPILIDAALNFFFVAPEFIGPLQGNIVDVVDSVGGDTLNSFVELVTLDDGSQVVSETSSLGTPGQQVVVATEADLARTNIDSGPGVYAVNSGNNGTAPAMASLGIFYGALGMLGSRFMRVPHPDWRPNLTNTSTSTVVVEGGKKNKDDSSTADAVQTNVGLSASYVTTNTLQFPLLWLSVFGNATGGLALLSSSKLMIIDIWGGILPNIVTPSFASHYVSALGIGMAAGRFGWSTLSDKLGRQNTYTLFGLGIPIVGLAPTLCQNAAAAASVDESSIVPLLASFYGGSVLAITFYGGIFSVLPAYIADLFGQKHAGAIHGKLLTAWAASAVAGPMGLSYLRSQSVSRATTDLIDRVEDEEAFQRAFDCSVDDLASIEKLIDAKTISISRLMEVVPAGTPDPTPFLYDSTCHIAAGLMGVSALANLSIRPIDLSKTSSKKE